MEREAPEESPKLARNALFDLRALARSRERAPGSKRALGQGLSGRERTGPRAPRCCASIWRSRERAGFLRSSRKNRTHCSTAAVCSLLSSGMLSGANSIFMAQPGEDSARRGCLEPRCSAAPRRSVRNQPKREGRGQWPRSGRGLDFVLGRRAHPGRAGDC